MELVYGETSQVCAIDIFTNSIGHLNRTWTFQISHSGCLESAIIILRLPNQFMAHSPHQIIENFSQLPYPAFVLVALCSL